MAENEGVCKVGDAFVIAESPDVCKTPVGGAMTPVPYQIVAYFSESSETVESVHFGGNEAFTTIGSIKGVIGDEPGIGKGLVSGSHAGQGHCHVVRESHTMVVRAEKNYVVWHTSKMEMNCPDPEGIGNTKGTVIYFSLMATVSVDDDGNIVGNTNPDVEPETPEEAQPPSKSLLDHYQDYRKKTQEADEYILNDLKETFTWENIKGSVVDTVKFLGDAGKFLFRSTPAVATLEEFFYGTNVYQETFDFAGEIWGNRGAIWDSATKPFTDWWGDMGSALEAGNYGEFLGTLEGGISKGSYHVVKEIGVEVLTTKGAGIALKAVKLSSKSVNLLRKGATLADLLESGEDLSKLRQAGASLDDLLSAGAKRDDLVKAGFSRDEVFGPLSPQAVGKVEELGEDGVRVTKGLYGKAVDLPRPIEIERRTLTKRDGVDLDEARKKFNSTDRKAFLKDLGNDPDKVKALKDAGLTDADIADMRDGLVPDGFQVHHKVPIDLGGSNNFDNLVLIKNHPYHKALTNLQNSLFRGKPAGTSFTMDWPMPGGFVYPPGGG